MGGGQEGSVISSPALGARANQAGGSLNPSIPRCLTWYLYPVVCSQLNFSEWPYSSSHFISCLKAPRARSVLFVFNAFLADNLIIDICKAMTLRAVTHWPSSQQARRFLRLTQSWKWMFLTPLLPLTLSLPSSSPLLSFFPIRPLPSPLLFLRSCLLCWSLSSTDLTRSSLGRSHNTQGVYSLREVLLAGIANTYSLKAPSASGWAGQTYLPTTVAFGSAVAIKWAEEPLQTEAWFPQSQVAPLIDWQGDQEVVGFQAALHVCHHLSSHPNSSSITVC